MSEENVPKQKPIIIKTRKNLLYSSAKRRSVRALLIISIAAFLAGIFIAYALKGLSELKLSGRGTSRENVPIILALREVSIQQDRHNSGELGVWIDFHAIPHDGQFMRYSSYPRYN